MVGIVVVSHSEAIAEGIVELARQMGGEDLALEPAGGWTSPAFWGPIRSASRERSNGRCPRMGCWC